MNKKRLMIAFVAIFLAVAVAEIVLLSLMQRAQKETIPEKQAAVFLTGLPDLALSTEARFIRHRSLSAIHDYFGDEGTLPEYFPSAFAYAPPPYQRAHARITGE
jgi:hypothetical protein